MRELGIRGVKRARRVRTTCPDDRASRPADLVDRDFTADRPDRLWVSDLTHVSTWSGVAYVCFIIDAFSRRIVGWRVASNMKTPMVLDALEMARWTRGYVHSEKLLRKCDEISASASALAASQGISKPERKWQIHGIVATRLPCPAAFFEGSKVEFCTVENLRTAICP